MPGRELAINKYRHTPADELPTADEVSYTKKDSPLYIELHRHLFDSAEDAHDELNHFFVDIAPVEVDGFLTMPPHEHLLYLILHAYKHFVYSGIGLRQFCDIGLWAQAYHDQIDWQRLHDQCAGVHAATFAAAAFRIARTYLDIDFDLPGLWDGDVDVEPLLHAVLRVHRRAGRLRILHDRRTLHRFARSPCHGIHRHACRHLPAPARDFRPRPAPHRRSRIQGFGPRIAFRHRTRSARRRHSQHEGRAVMSDDKDDLNGFDGLGKTNDDGMHFSEEELEAAMAGFEKEFQDEEAAQQNDAPAQVPFDQPDETVNSDASSDESQDGLQSKEADAVLSEAENSLSFDDELQGLLGNRAKVAVIITRLASARLFAAFCQLSDISAQCLASPQGAVAVLRNLDGDGPEAAIKDLTTVVSGMPAVLAINRADKLEATMYLQGKVGQTFAPPVLLTSTAPFVEDLLLGITDVQGVRDSGVETVDSASLTRDDAMKILAEHTRFGRGSSSIE